MRGVIRFLVFLVVVLAIGYVGGWWYVEGRMDVAFRHQEQKLRAAGWTIGHGATRRGASPLVAAFSVADLTMTPPQSAVPSPRITLPDVQMRVHVTAPFTLDVGLPLAWHVAMAQGPAFTVRFSTIRDRYRFDPNALFNHAPDPLRRGKLDFTGMRIDSADTNFTLVSIAAFSGTVTHHAGADKTDTALVVHERLTGLALSPIFVTLAHLPFDGKLGALGIDVSLSGPGLAPVGSLAMAAPANPLGADKANAAWQVVGPVLHQWAQAGGHGTFAVKLAVGPLNARTKGDFGFDATTQPNGKAVLVADGLGAFLGDVAAAYPGTVGLISALSARTAPYMTKGPANGQRLSVKFGVAGGVLTANGQKLAAVPPLVWPPAMKAAP